MGRQCEVSGKKTSFGNHKTSAARRNTWVASVRKPPGSAAGRSSRTCNGFTSGYRTEPLATCAWRRRSSAPVSSRSRSMGDEDVPSDQGFQGLGEGAQGTQEPVSDLIACAVAHSSRRRSPAGSGPRCPAPAWPADRAGHHVVDRDLQPGARESPRQRRTLMPGNGCRGRRSPRRRWSQRRRPRPCRRSGRGARVG